MAHIERPPPPLPPALSELARSATACEVVGFATYQNRFLLVEFSNLMHPLFLTLDLSYLGAQIMWTILPLAGFV